MCEKEPSAWRKCTISDCFKIDSGAAPGIFRDDTASIPLMGANGPIGACSASNFGPGYILGRVGAAGSVVRVQERVWASDNTLILEPKSHVEENFAHFLLLFVKPWELATITAQPLITQSNLSSLPVRLPSEKEQQHIAQILDTLDTTIRETEAIITKLKTVKQGLLHDLLTRGLDDNGELRPPQSEAPHLYKESPLGWIPKEWLVTTVSTEFIVDSGITLGSHRVPRNNPKPYLRVANIHRARLALDDIAFLEATNVEAVKLCLKPGHLLVVEGHANVNEIGRCAMATEEVEGFLFQNHLFRLISLRMNISFSLLWLNSEFAQSYWRSEAATSSGLYTINRTKLNRLLVVSPSPEEQEIIVDTDKSLEIQIIRESERYDKLVKLKSGLMDDLLIGRVRVTPLLNDLPATSPEAAP